MTVTFHPPIKIDRGTDKVMNGRLIAKIDGVWHIITKVDEVLRLVARDEPTSL